MKETEVARVRSGFFGVAMLVFLLAAGPLCAIERAVPTAGRKPAVAPAKKPAPMDENETSTFYSYKLSSYLGMTIFHGSALAVGAQFGYAPFKDTPFYVGPAVDFSLFAPGSLLSFLGGGWYELRIYGSPRLSLGLGALGGMGFNSVAGLPGQTVAEAFFQGAISQDIDDLVSVRGDFRPGIINGYFAFQMNFDVCFRFY